MKILLLLLLITPAAVLAQSQPLQHGPQLYCHRTANEDVPENTLESLEQAARLGCNVVEIDLRRTLDGVLVLNHDGVLDRLTDGHGTVDETNFAELRLLDAGSWMAPRFAGLHIARFDDALRLARSLDIRLILDIKTKGIGPDVLRILEREGMIDRVQFNGEWEDIRSLLPSATDAGSGTTWVQPGVSAADVTKLHTQGRAVIANFSANEHEMDLALMKAAAAAGVDGINVDYPRLGADAVGRPVEGLIHQWIEQAYKGSEESRARAILELSHYQDAGLDQIYLALLDNPSQRVSHTAALALISMRPPIPIERLAAALHSQNVPARANAAWLVGMLHAPTSSVQHLLTDADETVRMQALIALGRTTGHLADSEISPLFESKNPLLRGAAALALAHNQPESAATTIASQLQHEIENEATLANEYVAGGRKTITPEQIKTATDSFRGQMDMLHALAGLRTTETTAALSHISLQRMHEFAQEDRIVGCFQMWDRVGDDPAVFIKELASPDTAMANCAEWALVKADSRVLTAVRNALSSPPTSIRAIRIVAWHGDLEALPALRRIAHASGPDSGLAAWAIVKIQLLHPSTD